MRAAATFVGALVLFTAPPAHAESAQALADKVEANFSGFGGQRVRLEMQVREKNGETKDYRLVELAKESGDDLAMLVRFVAPEHLKGSALLVREPAGAPAEIWIYMAQMNEVRRVSGADRTARFLGSEIDIEQLTLPRARDYDHRVVGAGEVQGKKCTNVEQTPKAPRSNYAKLVTCVDTERAVPLSIAYFDRSGRALKRLVVTGYTKTEAGWRPEQIAVENLKSGRTTTLKFGKYRTGLKLADDLFSIAQMQSR